MVIRKDDQTNVEKAQLRDGIGTTNVRMLMNLDNFHEHVRFFSILTLEYIIQ